MQITRFILSSLLIGLLLWFIHQYVLIFGTYNYFVSYLQEEIGLNIWIIRMLSIFFSTITILYIYPILADLFNPLASNDEKKIGLLKMSVISIIYCLLLFSFTQGHHSKNCFITNYQGEYEECSCVPTIHPVYGRDVAPITPDIAFYLEKKEHGKLTETKIKASNKYKFFTADGVALTWYCIVPNGDIEVFEIPGVHPQYGKKLLPVTGEIVTIFLEQQPTNTNNSDAQKDLNKFLNDENH